MLLLLVEKCLVTVYLLVEKCLVTVYLLVEKCSHQFAILSRHLWQAASQWGAQGVTKIWTNLRSEHSFTMSTMMPLCQCQCLLFTQCTAVEFLLKYITLLLLSHMI